MNKLQKVASNILFALVIFAFVSPSLGQSFDGAWSITSWTTGDNPQSSLLIFHDGFYSWLSLSGTDVRPKYEDGESRNTLSLEKLQAIVLPVISNAGRYSIDGSTVTMNPTVAISPNLMDGGQIVFEFEKTENNIVLKAEGFSMTLARQM